MSPVLPTTVVHSRFGIWGNDDSDKNGNCIGSHYIPDNDKHALQELRCDIVQLPSLPAGVWQVSDPQTFRDIVLRSC